MQIAVQMNVKTPPYYAAARARQALGTLVWPEAGHNNASSYLLLDG